MNFSASNVFRGYITSLRFAPASTEVTVKTASGEIITASITTASAEKLGLAIRSTVSAAVSASSVMLCTERPELSAQNILAGRAVSVRTDPVSAEVSVLTENGTAVSACITAAAAESLGLSSDSRVFAVFPASSVMIVAE